MKRLWFAIIFLTAAIISCSYEQVVIRLACKDISSVIDKAVVSEGTDEKIEYCNDALLLWNKYRKKIALVTDHSNFEDADVYMSKIRMYSNSDEGNNDELDEALTEAKSQLEQTYKSSKINLSNIF